MVLFVLYSCQKILINHCTLSRKETVYHNICTMTWCGKLIRLANTGSATLSVVWRWVACISTGQVPFMIFRGPLAMLFSGWTVLFCRLKGSPAILHGHLASHYWGCTASMGWEMPQSRDPYLTQSVRVKNVKIQNTRIRRIDYLLTRKDSESVRHCLTYHSRDNWPIIGIWQVQHYY